MSAPFLRSLRAWAVAAGVVAAFATGCGRSPPPPAGEDPAPGARTLTVAFWNLEWFPGRHPRSRPEAQAAHVAAVVPVAERIDADVFGLEEIADRDAARLVADRLRGFKVDVCSEFTRPGGDGAGERMLPDRQQIALCSRLPLAGAGWEPWRPSATGLRQRRGFVWAVYRPTAGEAMLVYGLHLKSNVVDEPGGEPVNVLMREEAARQLLAHQRAAAAAWSRTSRLRLVIVGGDLNTSLDDARFEAETTLRTLLGDGGFQWGWARVPLPRRVTLPAKGRYPATCFDHVLYRSGDDSVRLTSARVENSGTDASDHHPVVARFAW